MKEEGNIPEENTSKEENTEKKKPENPPESKEKPVNQTKFIGFHRLPSGGPWTLFPQALSSEESVEHKIKFMKGDCETYIIEVDLPK